MTATTLPPQWESLAQELHQARQAGILLPHRTAEALPPTKAAAYAVQDRTIDLDGREPRAWKLGATMLAAQNSLGLSEPFAGPVLQQWIMASPAQLDVRTFSCTVFEPEIAFKLGSDIDRPISEDEAAAAIATWHAAIEVINFRFIDGRLMNALGMITDLGANGGLVVGPAMAEGVFDYATLPLEVRINGHVVANRTPPPPETDPVGLLVWFSRHVTDRGYVLKRGDVITTGSQAGVIPYQPGDLVEADFGPGGIAAFQS
ncbi:fumarylacetoacetate hydrolase family protein [Novosphingobium sp. PASSN1]|uniref:2-keto-4-pentenoate hydratase n=1 Tax=Novosphingobium sp. PASSN1 TaxID=2015561 RepID=UPI000BCB1287|nr:fumarylacetoacetate hydrolase family protein [Novosphingobium sp. PASSN1]OYU34778.1 MAG: hypothetical protein CFE35_12865 [Novosphingobium sp. PASSN1]